MRKIILFIFGILSLYSVHAQLILDAEIRPRYEMRNGYKKLSDSGLYAAHLISQRTRIGSTYKTDKFTMRISVQDVRIWGDEKLKDDNSTLGLHEAWVSFKLADSLTMKVGRQELIYDNQRLISNSNWTQKGNQHEAALLMFKHNNFSLNFAAAMNRSGDSTFNNNYSSANVKDNYKYLSYLWATQKIGKLTITATSIFDGYQYKTNTDFFRGTFGGGLSYKLSPAILSIRSYYQTGKDKTGKMISAYYVSADAAMKVGDKLTVTPGIEYLSGNDAKDTLNKKINGFSTLYGTGHSFNGHMDYFTSYPSDTKNGGLVNPYLKFTGKINDKIIIGLDYHYFALQNNYISKSTGNTIDKYLGSEFDLNCRYDISKEFNVFFGYSFMFASESMETIKGGDNSKIPSWAFVMLTFKPTFK